MKPVDCVAFGDCESYNLLVFPYLRIKLFAGDYQP